MAELKDLLAALKIPNAAEAASALGRVRPPAMFAGDQGQFHPNAPATLMGNVFEMIDPAYKDPKWGGINLGITQMREQFRANMAAAGRDPATFTWNDLFDPKLATIKYKGKEFLAGDLLTRAVQGDPALAELFGQTTDRITQGMAGISSRTQTFIHESLPGLRGPSVPDRGGADRKPTGERRTDYKGLLDGVPLAQVALHDAGSDPQGSGVYSGLPSDAPGRFTS